MVLEAELSAGQWDWLSLGRRVTLWRACADDQPPASTRQEAEAEITAAAFAPGENGRNCHVHLRITSGHPSMAVCRLQPLGDDLAELAPPAYASRDASPAHGEADARQAPPPAEPVFDFETPAAITEGIPAAWDDFQDDEDDNDVAPEPEPTAANAPAEPTPSFEPAVTAPEPETTAPEPAQPETASAPAASQPAAAEPEPAMAPLPPLPPAPTAEPKTEVPPPDAVAALPPDLPKMADDWDFPEVDAGDDLLPPDMDDEATEAPDVTAPEPAPPEPPAAIASPAPVIDTDFGFDTPDLSLAPPPLDFDPEPADEDELPAYTPFRPEQSPTAAQPAAPEAADAPLDLNPPPSHEADFEADLPEALDELPAYTPYRADEATEDEAATATESLSPPDLELPPDEEFSFAPMPQGPAAMPEATRPDADFDLMPPTEAPTEPTDTLPPLPAPVVSPEQPTAPDVPETDSTAPADWLGEWDEETAPPQAAAHAAEVIPALTPEPESFQPAPAQASEPAAQADLGEWPDFSLEEGTPEPQSPPVPPPPALSATTVVDEGVSWHEPPAMPPITPATPTSAQDDATEANGLDWSEAPPPPPTAQAAQPQQQASLPPQQPMMGSPAPAAIAGKWEEGQRVRHSGYGEGTVTHLVEVEGSVILTVQFDSSGRRLLDPARSPLESI